MQKNELALPPENLPNPSIANDKQEVILIPEESFKSSRSNQVDNHEEQLHQSEEEEFTFIESNDPFFGNKAKESELMQKKDLWERIEEAVTIAEREQGEIKGNRYSGKVKVMLRGEESFNSIKEEIHKNGLFNGHLRDNQLEMNEEGQQKYFIVKEQAAFNLKRLVVRRKIIREAIEKKEWLNVFSWITSEKQSKSSEIISAKMQIRFLNAASSYALNLITDENERKSFQAVKDEFESNLMKDESFKKIAEKKEQMSHKRKDNTEDTTEEDEGNAHLKGTKRRKKDKSTVKFVLSKKDAAANQSEEQQIQQKASLKFFHLVDANKKLLNEVDQLRQEKESRGQAIEKQRLELEEQKSIIVESLKNAYEEQKESLDNLNKAIQKDLDKIHQSTLDSSFPKELYFRLFTPEKGYNKLSIKELAQLMGSWKKTVQESKEMRDKIKLERQAVKKKLTEEIELKQKQKEQEQSELKNLNEQQEWLDELKSFLKLG